MTFFTETHAIYTMCYTALYALSHQNIAILLVTLALLGKLNLDPITPIFTWLVWPTIPRTSKPKTDETDETDGTDETEETDETDKTDKDGKADKKTRWKFWAIYYNIGLQGEWKGFFLENKTMIPQIVIETTVRLIMTMTFSSVTQGLSSLAANDDIDLWMPYLYAMMALMVFNLDINHLINVLFHKSKVAYRNKVMNRITRGAAVRTYSSSISVLVKNDAGKYFSAMPSYAFCFEDITDNIGNLIIQFLRTVVFFCYIMWKEPRTFIPFLLAYNIIIKKLIPLIMYDPQFRGLRNMWGILYFNTNDDHNKAYNPATIGPIFQNVLAGPDSFQAMSQEYSDRVEKMSRSRYYLSFVKGAIVFGIALFACQIGGYDLALLVIMSGRTVFDVVDMWVNCQQIQSRADRSMDKMLDIFDEVDKADNKTIDDEIEIGSDSDAEFQFETDSNISGIQTISFDSMVVKLDPDTETMGAGDSKTESDSEEKENLVIYIMRNIIDVFKRGITLLDGPSGCGKTSVLSALAGMCDETSSLCQTEDLQIVFGDGEIRTDFTAIRCQRYYILQFMTELYLYNNAIDSPMSNLFRGAETIDEVRAFLIDVFKLKPNTIPKSLDDKPPKTLSGGERQRYVLAIQFWMIMKIAKEHRLIILLDEPFRNIDVVTAQHIMSWILENVDAYFFMVTHISEIKDLIRGSNALDQVWKFEVDADDEEKVYVTIE
jgi:ABC-type lipoprotein export system ATPase subunit